jgi:hypothetical protein
MANGILTRAVAVIVSIVFVVGSWIIAGSPDLIFVRLFSIAVLVASSVVFAWDRWMWKWPLAQRIPGVTRDVSGTWETTLESMWTDPASGTPPDPKTVFVVIRQTSSFASLSLISNESTSSSSIARLIREDGIWLVHFVYTNEPGVSVRGRSPIHHGSGVLSIVGSPAKRLAGSYWTDRDSRGTLALSRRSGKYAEDYSDGLDLFSPT